MQTTNTDQSQRSTGEIEIAPTRVLQMRLIVEAHDYEEALHFYRQVLGAEEEFQLHSPDGEHVTILDVGRATLEISNPAQIAMIDRVEVGHRVSPHLRVAFEVVDAATVTQALVVAGAELLAPPVRTPWGSLNSRLEAPGHLQITVFEEPGTTGLPSRDPGGPAIDTGQRLDSGIPDAVIAGPAQPRPTKERP